MKHFLVVYNQWQLNRFNFGEANQFQSSWEQQLIRFSAKLSANTARKTLSNCNRVAYIIEEKENGGGWGGGGSGHGSLVKFCKIEAWKCHFRR